LLFRAELVQFLNQEPGWRVCSEADNIVDALRLIEHMRPDAAIVALKLRGANGLELIKDLQARKLWRPCSCARNFWKSWSC
jgi:DNA-binding NarL/FixJ family response regulator